jgi:hypothetical protein
MSNGALWRAHPPRPKEAELIRSAGLDPTKWLVMHSNALYLYICDNSLEQRESHIIDKKTGELVGSPSKTERCP